MLKTERMRRVVVAGARDRLRTVIDTLHRLQVLHIEEHHPDSAVFGIGASLPEGESIAQSLLVARGLQKSIGLAGASATPLDSHEAAITAVKEMESGLSALLSERSGLQETVKSLEGDIVRARRLATLGLRLEHLTGYTQVKSFIGGVASDPEADLRAKGDRFELVKGTDPQGTVIALFVPRTEAEAAESVLTAHGFAAIEPPVGTGTVDAYIGEHTTQAREKNARVQAIDQQLEAFRREHGGRLLSAIRTLLIAADKATAPTRMAASPNAFVVSGYVPVSQARAIEDALMAATDHRIHVEWHEPALGGHGHDHDDEKVHGHANVAESRGGDESHVPPREDPPIKFTHKDPTQRSFTMILGMHSLPKYRELDPTLFIYLTFPIFFGLMMGDAAFGVLVMLVAWYFRRHHLLGIGGPKVSRMLMLSGFWTLLFGLFFYGEAFGIHFVDRPCELSWEWLLGQDWSASYTGGHRVPNAAALDCSDAATQEFLEGLHAPHLLLFGVFQLGFYSKLHDVTTLLIIALGIAAVHLNVAILLGIRNMWVMHGAKHAILGRVSWVVLEAGVFFVAFGGFKGVQDYTYLGWGLFALAVVMLIAGEGALAILELPKIFSNGLSYTRLTAVALSKAGMILAVNAFAFTMPDAVTAKVTLGGAFLMLFGYVVILALGILSAGLHALRLQLVEFFGWFYEGGGQAFRPFGEVHDEP